MNYRLILHYIFEKKKIIIFTKWYRQIIYKLLIIIKFRSDFFKIINLQYPRILLYMTIVQYMHVDCHQIVEMSPLCSIWIG